MNAASGKSRRRLTTGKNATSGAGRPARERATDVWPPVRKLTPPKIPPAAPPNSLATSTMWSREASSIGGRSSMASLKAHFMPDTPASEDSGSAHTALPLEDDWVPSYQRFKGPAAVERGTAATKSRRAAAATDGRSPSPYAMAMSTLAALSAGLPPQPLAPSDPPHRTPHRQRKASRPRPAAMQEPHAAGANRSRLEMFPALQPSGFSSSGSSSWASDRPRLRRVRKWSSDTEAAQGPQRGWSSDTEGAASPIKRSPNTPLRRAANGLTGSGDLLQRQAGLLMREGSLQRRDARYQQAEIKYWHHNGSMVLPGGVSGSAAMPVPERMLHHQPEDVTAAAFAAARAELAAREAVASSPNRMEAARQLLEEHSNQRLRQRLPVQQAAPAEVGATVSLVPRCLQPAPERLGHPLSKSKLTMLLIRTLSQELTVTDPLAIRMRERVLPMRSLMFKLVPTAATAFLAKVEDELTGCPGICNFLDARSRWLDAAVARAIADGFRQVVVLTAGFSTLFHRFKGQGATFFEVEFPAASAHKRKLVAQLLPDLKRGMRPVFVGADLGRTPLSAALAQAGHIAAEPTLFVAEGLVFCLSPTSVSNLLAEISSISTAGSRLYFDFLHKNQFDRWQSFDGVHVVAKLLAEHSSNFKSGIDPDYAVVSALLAAFSFRPFQISSPRDLASMFMPHVMWTAHPPPLPPFFGFIGAAKVFGTEGPGDPEWPADQQQMMVLEGASISQA